MQRIKKGTLFRSASGEIVMYRGIIVDHDGTHYEIQRFGGVLDRVAPEYFHEWYRPARAYIDALNRQQWRQE